ncbi:MAG: DEAD/DEAH box helicase [Armatimonadetes bacterium]|nr:DEAD/DEAH box helicase [Armatimonadota bacterium]MDW8152730.1 DEAD/DEAH box helicase [Armatimonadota bacterium]
MRTRTRKSGVHPALQPLLRKVGSPPPQPFTPSAFQSRALQALRTGDVLVEAPTGSGKTWIAEEAIREGLEEGRTAWYTTPLKALSNQKYRRFCGLYGADRVGLLTGERRIHPQAPVVVATTEILRNALYEGGIAPDLMVLDEAHYLSDPERGTAWEEIILYAPPTSTLLLLSATLPNLQELADWMQEVRGRRPTIVEEQHRPVPLVAIAADGLGRLLPLELAHRVARLDRAPDWVRRVVRSLEQAQLLPAILFFPTRRQCDEAVRGLSTARAPGEEERISAWAGWEAEFPYLRDHPQRRSLLRAGVAAHHAGHLTAWRMVVEDFLERGLVRAVCATTTLAAGLDVPARTVLLTTLVRNSPEGPVGLSATEFHQMAGRAGRRGRDTLGFVVLPATRPGELADGEALLSAEPEPIQSAFTPSYASILNLLRWRTLEEALAELDRSLAAFQRRKEVARLRRLLAQIPSGPARSLPQLRRRERRRGELERTIRELEEGLREEFVRRARVLQSFGYLDANLRPTSEGAWAALLRHPRSLLLAELVRRRLLPLEAERLSAYAAALSSEQAPRRGEDADLGALRALVREIAAREAEAGLQPDPFVEEFQPEWDRIRRRLVPSPADRRATAATLWARGVAFEALAAQLDAQEGDLQRILLQAAEIANQLADLPHPEIREVAAKTRDLLLRPPLV